MDNKKNGIPKLRFPGFTGAWEQRKLGEVAEINPSSEIPDNFEYVDLESVVGTEMIAYRRENKKTAPSRAQRLAKKGDIFYQTVRPYQKNNYHFNLTRKDFVFSTGYAQLRPNINGDFLFVYIQLSNFVNEVLNRSTGTSYPAISPSNLIRMKVAIPTNNEQEKIGAFFKQLDSLIALHQRKLEHLQEQKKGLLQKMFPKNGETVPEVRFPGFTDAWEQRKLNEFLKTSKLKNENNKFTRKDVLSVSGDYGIVNQIKFKGRSFAGASVQKYRIVNTNDVVYTKSPLKNNPYGIIKANKGNPGIVSTLYAVYKINEKVNASFIEYYFENDYRLNTYLKPLVNKGAKNDMKVSDDNALIGNVIFPLEYSEQIKIVKFLNRFDTLIALHQRKPKCTFKLPNLT